MKLLLPTSSKWINKTNTTPTLFKHMSVRTHLKPLSFWSLKTPQAMLFKSFFVFLKPKPFIIKMRYNLLKNFILNPKPYTLSTLITLTKKFRPTQINTYFAFTNVNSFISKKKLLHLFLKNTSKNKKKVFFSLFKHKLFNYTTPKQIRITFLAVYSQFTQLDFRTNLMNYQFKRSFPNVHAISTYNWKIIN